MIIDDSIRQQFLKFQDRFRQRKMIKMRSDYKNRDRAKRNSTSFLNLNNDFIKFLNTERKLSDDLPNKPKKRRSVFYNYTTPIKMFNLSLHTESKLNKFKKKTLTINEVFEDFSSKYHYIYFLNLCDTYFKSATLHLNEAYQKKKENFFAFEDQIEELNFMFADEEVNDQYLLMIDDLKDKRDRNQLPIENELKTKIGNLSKLFELSNNTQFQEKFAGIIDDLINNLINILK